MRKLLLISVLLGSLTLAQKNNQSEPSLGSARDTGIRTNSMLDAVPRRLSYQGLLTKENGRAVSDGTYQVTFRLFKESSGGTAFWEETQGIGISDGVISATLGAVNPIGGVPANSYLEITIDETTLSPRQEMTSVFYSVVSDTAKYSQAGNYMDLDDRPDLSVYATRDTLSNYAQTGSLDSVAFTGSYDDLEDVPDLSNILESDTLGHYVMSDSLGHYVMSDSLSSYTLTSDLAAVALTSDYNDLTDLPDLSQYAALDTLASYVSSDTLSNFVNKDSLGTLAEQNSDDVSITGGSITDITDLAIADGGTGASDNSTARQNLGLEIGVDVQAHDADLADLADGSLSAEKVEYLENVTSDVQAQINAIGDGPVNSLEDLGVTADSTELNYVDGVTSSIQDQLDAKQDLNGNLTTLAGLAQNHDHFIVSDGTSWTLEADSDARESLGLGSMATQASEDVDITGGRIVGVVDMAIADGGTGASDITTARQNLGLEIGVDVQGYDADLTDLSDGTLTASKVQYLENVTSDVQAQLDAKMDSNAVTLSSLAHGDGNIIVSDGTSWTVESGADARTSLGLGSIATQAADNVAITGGSVTEITDITIADGGTGASDVASARSNLGLEIGVDVQAYDADLADLADGKLSASKVQHGEYFITTDGTNGQVWTSDGAGAGDWGDVAGITGGATTIDTENLISSRAVISNTEGKIAVSEVTTTELGYVEGVTSNLQVQLDSKQAKSSDLADIAGLAHADGNIIVSDGTDWTVESGADARTSLGLGSIATQAADNVAITGGSVTDITDIAVADGGTGASDIATARINLGLEIGVDVQAYDADLADLADGELSASKVQYAITTEGTNGQVWTSDGDGAGDWGDPAGLTGAGSTIDSEDLTASRALISNASGKVDTSTVTLTELGYMDGVTSSVQTQLDAKQAADDDLTDLADGTLSASKVENNEYFITSAGTSGQVWTSDADGAGDWGDPAGLTGAGSTIDSEDLTASRALISNASGKVDTSTVTLTELGYMDGVTSSVQTQLDAKQAADDDLTDLADGTLSASKVENNEYFITSAGTSGQVWTSDADGAGDWGDPAGLTGAGSTIDSEDLTASRALISNASGKVDTSTVTLTELGYMDGVTSSVQTQLDAKQAADDDLTDLADGTLSASKVENNEYFITSAGTSGQVWTSDGDGVGDWATNSAASNINGLSDALVEDTGSMYVGNDPSSTTDDANYNLAVGVTALDAITTGDKNTAVGYDVLSDNATGEQNSALGFRALKSTTNGSYNTAVGFEALYINTNSGNSAFGWRSLRANTSGTYNTASGFQSLVVNSEGDNNTAMGYRSLYGNTTSDYNTAMGFESLHDANRTADQDGYNSALGYQAGNTGTNDITTGNKNTLLGASTAASDEAGTNQTIVGYGASGQADNSVTLGNADVTAVYMSQDKGATVYAAALGFGSTSMTLPTADGSANQLLKTNGSGTLSWTDNTAAADIDGLSDAKSGGDNFSNSIIIGHETTGTLNNANNNTAIGVNALDAITSGDGNTAFGLSSLTNVTTGNYNAAQGAYSLRDLTSGTKNVAMGNSSLRDLTSGLKNSGLGQGSAYRVTTGDFNVGLGYRSADTISTGNNNVIVGSFADPSKADASNQIVLGHRATGQADNSVTLGNADVTEIYMAQDSGATVYAAALGFGDVAMTLPTADGSSDQVLKTNGSGTLSWGSAATSINGLSDALVEDTGSMYVGNDPSSTTDAADYNVAIGTTALDAVTTGDSNTALGYDALTDNIGGNRNTAIGAYALKDNTSGIVNVAVGSAALDKNTTGNSNTAVGHSSAYSLTSGSSNVSMGWKSAFTVETGNNNVIIGSEANPSTDGGSTNQVVIGQGTTGQADNSVTLGNADVTAVYMSQDKGATVYAAALGFGSTSMTLPTADGSSDQVLKTNGSGTLSWGSAATSINGLSDALVEDTGSMYVGSDPSSTTDAADYNVAIGTTALDAVTTGDNNTAVGYDAMTANTTGSYNTAFGYKSLESNENGNRNIAIGMQSLQANSSGNYNTAVGMYSLYASATAAYNTAMGFNALKLVNRTADTDGYNTALGYNAGTTGTNDITTGNKNTLLGASTAASVATGTNQTVIGYGTSGQASNSVTLGNADVTAVYMAQDQGATVYAAGVDITGSSGLILENDETITNSTDGTILIDGKADFNDNAITGYGADLQSESGTTKTLAAADNGTIIVCSSNSAITITVPASLPSGFNCMIIQNGSGQISLSASSTTLNNRNGSKTAGQYAIMTLVHLGSDVFVVSGDTSS